MESGEGEYRKFIDLMKSSTDACSARLMEASKNVHALHEQADAFKARVDAEDALLKAAQADLKAANDAIKAAEAVKDSEDATCDEKQRQNAELHAQLVEELQEVEQLADPEYRASMAGRNFTKEALDISAAARTGAPETGAPETGAPETVAPATEVSLLQKVSQHRSSRGSSKRWTKEQCISFISWERQSKKRAALAQQKSQQKEEGKLKIKQDPGTDAPAPAPFPIPGSEFAGAPAEDPDAAPTEAECE